MTGPHSRLCTCCAQRLSVAVFAGISEVKTLVSRSKARAPLSFVKNLKRLRELEDAALVSIATRQVAR